MIVKCWIVVNAILAWSYSTAQASQYTQVPRGGETGSSFPTTTTSSSPCSGVPTISTHRKACGFYIWDAPSALLYKWCHHLLKDHLYEGRGGHMFVRYESNSILQLLYPCSRYSPNRCLVCGGNYPDHLELWWSKRLYTPFDRHLDKTYEAALRIQNDESSSYSSRRSWSHKRQPKVPIVTGPPTYSFHAPYVLDISDILQKEPNKKKQSELVKQKLAKDKENVQGWRITSFPQFKVGYVLPPLKADGGKRPSLMLRFVRGLVLGNLDSLIFLQESENAKLRN